MPLLGKAAVAMWWDMAPSERTEFEHWHSHEHFPERLGIPGFLRSSRWADAASGEGFFVMYELDALETLTSEDYLARLNDPTPWSRRMMPLHRNMVRSLCAITLSYGGGIASAMLTVRLSPQPGSATVLLDRLRETLRELPLLPGVTAAHLLTTQAADPGTPLTAEQRIRGGDGAADWILLVNGYDAAALGAITSSQLDPDALIAWGAQPGSTTSRYELRYELTPADF